jgi:dihydrodipicolinate synthase/N-acetylneuraminate lyase
MNAQRISGTVSAAVTPLRDDGRQVDEDVYPPLLQFYRDGGVDGVLALGTTGEGVLLSADERRRVAELVVAGADALRVIVHCGAQTTAETVALAAHAAEAGADGVAVIAPPYFAFAADEVLEHLAAAAAACAPLPFYVYEFAARSGYVVPVSVVEQLRERASNLAGMKVSDAPFERAEPYLATGLDVFIGAEAVLRQGLERGAVGAVSGVAAAFPELVAGLVHDPTAERSTLLASLRGVLSEHPFQASIKATLAMRGVPIRPDVRAPLLPLRPEAIEHLRGELERLLGEDALAAPRPLSRRGAGA